MSPATHVRADYLTVMGGEVMLPDLELEPMKKALEISMRCACCNRVMELFERYICTDGQKQRIILRCAACRWATEF